MKTIDQSYDREQHDTIIKVVLYLLGNVMILWIFLKLYLRRVQKCQMDNNINTGFGCVYVFNYL